MFPYKFTHSNIVALAPDRMKRSETLPARRPSAVLFVNDQAFAGVCAWCTDKDEADTWCEHQGLQATHTICPTCRARLKNEYEMVQKWRVA